MPSLRPIHQSYIKVFQRIYAYITIWDLYIKRNAIQEHDINMGKLSVSLSKEDEKELRKIAEDNRRTISGQISYWIKQDVKK